MTDQRDECGAAAVVPAYDFRKLSTVFCANLVSYDLLATEVLLLLILKLETIDQDRIEGVIDFEEWGARLRVRPDKLRRLYFEPLVKLGIIDFDGQRVYKLRPAMGHWSRARGLRVPDRGNNNLDGSQGDLALVADRPLSAALTEVSMEAALCLPISSTKREEEEPTRVEDGCQVQDGGSGPAAAPEWQRDLDRLKAELNGQRAEVAAEKSAEVFGTVVCSSAVKKSDNAKRPLNTGGNGLAEKSAVPIASLGVDRSSKAKLARPQGGPLNSPQPAAVAGKATRKAEDAWLLVQAWDKNGDLQRSNYSARRFLEEWKQLCNADPDFILEDLAKKAGRKDIVERVEKGWSALAYLASTARAEGRFKFAKALAGRANGKD